MRFILLLLIAFNAGESLLGEDQWWQFRGPNGNGHIQAPNLPLNWTEDKNVVWKTPIHDRGWSSPVIWNNQIWLTTATADGRKMFAVCVDKMTGSILHDIHIFDVENPQRIAADNSYATPTSVIDRERVYLHYGTYGTACLDSKSGRILWTRRDLNCDHESGAGPASSPMLVGNLFVVNVDGRDVQYVIALDKTNGKTVWKTTRSVDYSKTPVNQRKAYSMPIVIPRGEGTQLVSNGAKGIFSYDPVTGKELWRVQHHGFSNAPRPVFGHGLVFTTVDHDNPELWAIRADGSGDVTDTHIAWKETRAMPPRCSPLLVGDLLFLVNRRGITSCLDAITGDVIWKERLEGAYSASPIHANGGIYMFNEDSVCTIIKPARKLEILATNRLPKDILMATPAVSDNALFIRTERYLYRVQKASIER